VPYIFIRRILPMQMFIIQISFIFVYVLGHLNRPAILTALSDLFKETHNVDIGDVYYL
jgi:hypothetical protein